MDSRRLSGDTLSPYSGTSGESHPYIDSDQIGAAEGLACPARIICPTRSAFAQKDCSPAIAGDEKQWSLPKYGPLFNDKDDHYSIKKAGDRIITDKGALESITRSHTLPYPLGTELQRRFYSFFSLYRIIFAFIIFANVVSVAIYSPLSAIDSSDAATAAAINICIAVAFRNEHVINAVWHIACSLKPSAPLRVRRVAGKVYSYGGFHSGCAVTGTLWYMGFTIILFVQPRHSARWLMLGSAIAVSTILIIITCLAFPSFRVAHHNIFEAVHRFGGWTAIALLWVQLGVSTVDASKSSSKSAGTLLVANPLFWCLVVIVIAILYPWSRLRLRNVHVQVLSPRAALLHFDYRRMGICLGVRITDSPLKETHSFATITNVDDEYGFRVLMSRAGDWTAKFIDDPPSKIWVKGAPTRGVIRVALLFKKVLVIATGTGIGPCLSLLESRPDHPMHVLWMGSSPRASYGDIIINSVYAADPDACIVDTSKAGRGDLLALAYSKFIDSQAEAVVIISNAKVTSHIVEGFESRGLPAYGAIFDS